VKDECIRSSVQTAVKIAKFLLNRLVIDLYTVETVSKNVEDIRDFELASNTWQTFIII